MSEMQTMRILLFGVVNAGSKKKVKRRCTFVYNEKTKELENETAMRTTYNRVDKSDPLHVVGHGAKEKKKTVRQRSIAPVKKNNPFKSFDILFRI